MGVWIGAALDVLPEAAGGLSGRLAEKAREVRRFREPQGI